jgi:hypothetical protein
MSIFKRKQNKEEVKETTTPATEQSAAQEQPEEEWIWVEGYKGTDANMCCRGYQYELGKQFDMPDDAKIKECENGFHLCLKLDDVFGYYNIGEGNRFFKVKALVHKKDYDTYGEYTWYSLSKKDKIASKSIVFVSELTRDEILKGTGVEKLPEQYKDNAIKNSINYAVAEYQSDTLIADGYSVAFAASIVKSGLFSKAHAVGSQSDLSMDMKVLWILS